MKDKNTDFVKFTSKKLAYGNEVVSYTEYKSYLIRLRTYNGASVSINKVINNKQIELYKRNYSFGKLSNLLDKAKKYIDHHEDVLIEKLKTKINC